jgi:PPM family protein phosphatase
MMGPSPSSTPSPSRGNLHGSMRLSHASASDVGRKRPHNEDAFLLLPEEQLWCVADGMGGHASGEVAARIAVEEMAEFFSLTGRDDEATWPYKLDPARGPAENRLLTGVKLANLRIHERAQLDPRLHGMGTTVVAASFLRDDRAVLIAHVGDSRAYLVRQGAIQQLTEDHSLLNDYRKTRALSPEEIEAFPHKNVIVRALGMKPQVEIDLRREALVPGDVVLLCSDGLSGMVPDARIAEIVRGAHGDLRHAAGALVDAANAAGGGDNVTCVLVQALD